MERPRQSIDSEAEPGDPCTRPGSCIDLCVVTDPGPVPAGLETSARKWLAPFLSVSRLALTVNGFVASGVILDEDRLMRNLMNAQVKIKGVIFKVTMLDLQQSETWRENYVSENELEMASWSSEFDTTDDEVPAAKSKRPRTPTQKKARNKRRKQARARKRSVSGSSNEGVGTIAPWLVRTPDTTSVPVPSIVVPSVPVQTIATPSAAELFVPVSSVAISSIPVPSTVSPDNGAEASAPATTDNGAPTLAPASTNAAQAKKKTRYLTLDLNRINLTVSVTPRDTYLFRPVDPSQSLRRCNPRDQIAQLGTLGKIIEIRDIRAGGFAVDFEPTTANHAALLATTDVQGIKLTVTRPLDSHANACGVITGIHPDLTSDDLAADLVSEVPATAFKRLAKPNQQSWVLKVTFSGPTVPKHVFLYGRRHAVKPYETRPLQCFNCSRFGHPARTCRSATRCATCSGAHATTACPTPTTASCANCGKDHAATDPNCPSRAFQAKVLETKQTHGLTFRAARTAVNKATRSYAAALVGPSPTPRRPGPAPSTNLPIKTIATQTEPTVVLTAQPAQLEESNSTTPDPAKILQAILHALTAANASSEIILAVSTAFVPFLQPCH